MLSLGWKSPQMPSSILETMSVWHFYLNRFLKTFGKTQLASAAETFTTARWCLYSPKCGLTLWCSTDIQKEGAALRTLCSSSQTRNRWCDKVMVFSLSHLLSERNHSLFLTQSRMWAEILREVGSGQFPGLWNFEKVATCSSKASQYLHFKPYEL